MKSCLRKRRRNSARPLPKQGRLRDFGSTGASCLWADRLRHPITQIWNLRLFRHSLGRYEKLTGVETASGDNEVHEHVVVRGPTKRLQAEMDHYAFPSVEVFIEKHNRYSNWEARVATAAEDASAYSELQHASVAQRRRLKRLAQHLPFRPLLRFLYVYLWQGGFLDGREVTISRAFMASDEFLSVAKTYELSGALPHLTTKTLRSRGAGEGDDVANVGDAGDEHQHPLEAKAEAGVRHGAVAPEVEIPFVVREVHLVPPQIRLQDLEAFLTLTSADDLADAGDKQIHRGHGFSVVVQAHVEGLNFLRIIEDRDWRFEMFFS